MRCAPLMQPSRAIRYAYQLKAITVVAFAVAISLIATSLRATAATSLNQCKSIDGHDDITLDAHSYKPHSREKSTAIKFKTIEKVRLRRLKGHCVIGRERYGFEQDVHGVTIEVDIDGKKVKRKFVCIKYYYTTPSGLACKREVRRLDWTAPKRFHDRYR